jgi:serine/threonine protein kinase
LTGPVQPLRLDGRELAGFVVRSLIGRGGMAYVYRAEDSRLGRTVALKVLAPEFSTNEEFRQRFLRESQLAASLDHPNIIPVYAAGEADGMLYIAMRYVEGSDLKALLAEGRLSSAHVVDIFTQVAAALDAAHARGLVHRDVKPANILVSSATDRPGHRHVYLSDFGITKRATTLTGVTAAGVIIGSIDYLAPEQISGKAVSARTDQYALGCAIYQSLTGSVPYVRDDDAALLWAHLVEPTPPVSQQRPDIPAAVDEVLARAMAKDPERRYDSCSAFLVALAAELRPGGPSTADTPAQTSGAPAPGAPSYGASPPGPLPQARRRDTPPGVHAGRATPVPARPSGEQARTSGGHVPQYGEQVRQSGGQAWPPQVFGYSPSTPPPAPASPGRTGWLTWRWPVLGAAVAVLFAVAAVLFFITRSAPTTAHSADSTVPVTFRYPSAWSMAGSGTTNVVFSPRSDTFFALFSQQSWTDAARVMREDPDGSVGLYTFFVSTRTDSEALVKSLLPREVTVGGVTGSRRIGGFDATQLSGVLSDPANPANRLAFQAYTVSLESPQSRTVCLVLFAPEKSLDEHRAEFDRLLDSVDFPG